ncbi:MAG: 3-hydroxyacyl-CoA dehydrogenase NAD-binding domain-containing protein [Terracidiphilus sp.]
MQVAIIGAGPLGRWLAHAAARAGYAVLLEDVMPANLHHAQEYLRQQLGPAALPMVKFVSTIEDAVREADLVIDCVPDELESKLEIFCLLDRMAPPRTVLITPTTRLSIADLASCTYRADKCVALAVDMRELTGNSMKDGAQLVSGAGILLRTPPQATPETVALVQEFWTRVGFVPRFEADRTQ